MTERIGLGALIIRAIHCAHRGVERDEMRREINRVLRDGIDVRQFNLEALLSRRLNWNPVGVAAERQALEQTREFLKQNPTWLNEKGPGYEGLWQQNRESAVRCWGADFSREILQEMNSGLSPEQRELWEQAMMSVTMSPEAA